MIVQTSQDVPVLGVPVPVLGVPVLELDGKPYALLIPGCFAQIPWNEAQQALAPVCLEYSNKMYGKVIPAPRRSFVAGKAAYGGVNHIEWEGNTPAHGLIRTIREKLETEIMPSIKREAFSYVLVHHYLNGRHHIGYHADKEALSTEVVSVTFLEDGAAPRSLDFRLVGKKYVGKACEVSVPLRHGDVLIMLAGCQRKFKHAMQKDEPRVLQNGQSRGYWKQRMSLTFRYFDPHGKSNPTDSERRQRADKERADRERADRVSEGKRKAEDGTVELEMLHMAKRGRQEEEQE